MNVNNHHVAISGYSSLSHRTVDQLTVSGKAVVENVTCKHSFTCSGKVDVCSSTFHSAHISGYAAIRQSTAAEISVSGHLRAEDCPNLGSIKASGQLHLVNCPQVDHIQSSGTLSLLHTKVVGNVKHTGSDLQITNSLIAGKLTCSDKKIVIHQSYVNEIIVKKAESSFNIFCWNINIAGFKFFRHDGASSEQVVELDGPLCEVNTISFEEGRIGRVILKNGAKVLGPVLRGTVVEL